jgi:site-specific DNA-cytosine methylase
MARLYLVELFSGSGSVGHAVQARYEDDFEIMRHSVDIHAGYNPTTATDLLTWDYQPTLREFLSERTTRDLVVVWMSPPCTHYSVARTTAKTPRDLVGSDALVLKAIEIRNWVKPNYWIVENPVGMLMHRPIMASLEPFLHICSYCKYNKPFRKNTCIWTNVKVSLQRCCKATPCEHYRQHSKHAVTAQAGPSKNKTPGCKCAEAAYPIPAPLVHQLFDAAIDGWEEEALVHWGRSVSENK